MAAGDRFRQRSLWSWAILAAALMVAALFLRATERRYFEYADWTRRASASIESASVSPSGEAGTLSVVLRLTSPEVSFAATVDSIEFTLTRGEKHLGYFYTLPGEMTVESVPGATGYERIVVIKDIAREIAGDLFAGNLSMGEGSDDRLQLKGNVVMRIGLARGEKLARIPIAGEVMRRDGR
ncbi:MAG: hypothetical protein AB1700_06435 [Bacillota bacterium]